MSRSNVTAVPSDVKPGAPAIPFGEIAVMLSLPISTLEKLHRSNRGPKTFKIGRRIYVRRDDLIKWIDKLATAKEAA